MKPNSTKDHELSLTQQELNHRFRYDPMTGLLYVKNKTVRRTKIGKICGTRNSDGYLRVSINSRFFAVHRVIWAMVYGEWPKNMIDHINGNRDDNRLENLRAATRQENCFNQRISVRNTSGVKGVRWVEGRKKWRASVMVDYKYIHIGYFKSIEEAESATRLARENIHGKFARHS